jgi:pimeloyl-ACP methyl ester carboxylesterase
MTATRGGIREELVRVGGDRLDLRVQVLGEGPPLVYLHAASGLSWDPFLQTLATRRTVYAPLVPGTAAADPDAIDQVRDLWELVLLEQEALLSLGLAGADIIGASFGGMLGCELQATFPGSFGKLVLLDPIGLWRDDLPVTNWMMTPPAELPALLFADPSSAEAEASFAGPEDEHERADAIAITTWTLGCTAKFVWPIPDQGLERRLHRITAATLVIWGRDDALISCDYAAEFAARIAGARVEVIEACGHVPQVEQRERTLALVKEFLS